MRTTKLLLACSMCLAVGWCVGQRDSSVMLADTAPKPAPPLPQSGRLGASLWMNSAEYRACCVQTFRGAARRLQEILQTTRPMRPAIVMDLDETVLDNSAFQTFLYKNNLEFTQPNWDEFEEKYPQDVALVPGAQEFVLGVAQMGVRLIFISNRSQQHQKSTEAALQRLGFPQYELYLRPEKGPADKSARRDAIAAKYNVVMLVGDNLRDFSDAFAAKKFDKPPTPDDWLRAKKEREDAVDLAACHWGIDWFVLPNPVYGEWERLIGPKPVDLLRPTSMTKP